MLEDLDVEVTWSLIFLAGYNLALN